MNREEQTWELVDSWGACHTYRLRVPGGWLYRVESGEDTPDGKCHVLRSVVFVPLMQEQKHELLTALEAFVILQISRAHGYKLVKSGELKSVKIGRLRRVARADLDQFIGDLPRNAPSVP